eukprot:Rmarinus@m.11060
MLPTHTTADPPSGCISTQSRVLALVMLLGPFIFIASLVSLFFLLPDDAFDDPAVHSTLDEPVVPAVEVSDTSIRSLSTTRLKNFTFDLSTEPIDVVYTWVNGSDSDFIATLRHWRREYGLDDSTDGGGPAHARFEEYDHLRYSVRSLFKFAPFVRNIFFLSNGQVPLWLDTSHPRIRVVTHTQVFRNQEESLPTFCSNAIETRFLDIPGLSRRFLYMNDDFFYGAPVSVEDFFHPSTGLPYSYLEEKDHDETRCALGYRAVGTYWQAIQRNARLLWERGLINRAGCQLPFHMPYPIDKVLFEEMMELFSDEMEATQKTRFRTNSVAKPIFMYMHYILDRGSMLRTESDTSYQYVAFGGELVNLVEGLAAGIPAPKARPINGDYTFSRNGSLTAEQGLLPKFINIGDCCLSTDDQKQAMVLGSEKFYTLFPDPSPVEL